MEHQLDNLRRSLGEVSLTEAEKAAGKAVLREFMALRPVRVMGTSSVRQGTARPFGFLSLHLIGKAMSVFGLVLALMLSAGGVSYAAEGALPGDALYPVKVHVNEEVRAALAVSAEAKARWDAERVERRLAEAEAVVSREGTLSGEQRARVEANFQRHAEKVKERIADFRSREDMDAAADVAVHLEASLNAHKRILSELTAGAGIDADVASLATAVEAAAESAVKERRETEERIGGEAAVDARAAVEARLRGAEAKINEARAYLIKVRSKLGAEATAEADQRLIAAEGVVGEGHARLKAGDYRGAFALYLKAQRMAQEAKLYVKAQRDLKVRIGIEGDARWNDGGKSIDGRGDDGRDDAKDGNDDERKGGDDEDDDGRDEDRKDGSRARGEIEVRIGDGIEAGGDLEVKVRR